MTVRCASGFQRSSLSPRRPFSLWLQRIWVKTMLPQEPSPSLHHSPRLTTRCPYMRTVWTSQMVSRRLSMLAPKISTSTNATLSLRPSCKEHWKVTMHLSLLSMCIQAHRRAKDMEICRSCSSPVPWIGLSRFGVLTPDCSLFSALRVPKSMCMMHSGVPLIQVSSQVAMERE